MVPCYLAMLCAYALVRGVYAIVNPTDQEEK